MCGIAGFYHFDRPREASSEVIKRMTDAIAYRGPDGEGFFVKQNLALGHRRLSIIDLSTGQQPMFSDDNKIVLIFNGEIYNFVELRDQLIKFGCRFTTTSDTEVIINAYKTWGIDCQKHFNGMWAFALWDEEKERLMVSRDRIGEKPLYYSQSDNSFVFGSEIKSLLSYGITAEPRKDLTELYLILGFIPAPYTFHKNIYQLLPGQCMLISNAGVETHTYWDLPDISEQDLITDKKVIEEKFKELFIDSVRIRMRSDVGFGAFLSGGLDSSCVVGTMATQTKLPVQTFTIGFDNKQFDESHLAQQVSKKFKTIHHQGKVSSDSFDDSLKKVLHHYDDPFGDPSAIPTGYISRYAARSVKMVLTGDGGDEVLSGYTTYQGEKFAAKYQRFPKIIQRSVPFALKALAKLLRGNIRFKINRIVSILESSCLSFQERLKIKLAKTKPSLIHDIILNNEHVIKFEDYFSEVMKNCRFEDPFYQLMYFQHKITLPGDMLAKVDRMAMAYSLEARIPFLDYRIIEWMFRVHKDRKMDGYLNKVVLRNAVANEILPAELLTAPKKGFNVPMKDWFRENELAKKTREILLQDDGFNLFDKQVINKLLESNEGQITDEGNFIWQLLIIKSWLNKNSSLDSHNDVFLNQAQKAKVAG